MEPTAADIRSLVLGALAEIAPEADLSELDPQVPFRDQFDMDSVDCLNLILLIERRMGVHIPEDDFPQLVSLDGCLAYLPGRLRRG